MNTENKNEDELDELQDKLAQARGKGVGKPTKAAQELAKEHEEETSNMQLGIRAGTELLVGFIAGGLIGWGIDSYFDTKPIFFIIFLLLGVCSGFMNIYKITQEIGTSVGFAELHKRKKEGK